MKRNVAVVLILFAAAGILILLAHFIPANVIPRESPEMAQRRADRENNGWYLLEQVLKDAPVRPKAAWGPIEDDPGTEGYYTAKPGSLGQLVGIGRTDDDPVLLEYLAAAEKLFPPIRAILAKPYLLLPPEAVDPKSDRFVGPWSNNEFMFSARALFPLLLAHSYMLGLRPDRSSEAARVFRDSMELLDRMREGSIVDSCPLNPELVFKILQQLAPEDQRETLRWALDIQSRTRPSKEKIAADLRQFKGWLDLLARQGSVWHPMQAFEWMRYRTLFLRHSDYAFTTAYLNEAEFRRLLEDDPVLQQFSDAFYGHGPQNNVRMNTAWNGSMNGAITMLALELYKHDHGVFPESLDALIPEYIPALPDDPMAGRGVPFVYTRQDSGYRIGTAHKSSNYEFIRKLETGEDPE